MDSFIIAIPNWSSVKVEEYRNFVLLYDREQDLFFQADLDYKDELKSLAYSLGMGKYESSWEWCPEEGRSLQTGSYYLDMADLSEEQQLELCMEYYEMNPEKFTISND